MGEHHPGDVIRKECALARFRRVHPANGGPSVGRSARAHDRILNVAGAIADLGGSERVAAKHLDRNYWN